MRRVPKIYDSMSQELKPLALGRPLSWYSCGPTTYDVAHLGHARSYVEIDTIHRILASFFGIRVDHVMGITDVDKKVLNRAAQLRCSALDLSRKYEGEFFSSMYALGVSNARRTLRVTENIEGIISVIDKLVKDGIAYKDEAGVNFDLQKHAHEYNVFPSAPSTDPSDEDDAKRMNFALWKRSDEGELLWDSPWGKGRPGWHIECTAAIIECFDEPRIDVHAGGSDLCFPHHTNEVAQSTAYHNKSAEQLFGSFCHPGHLHIKGLKMSKSLKNFTSIADYLKSEGSRNQFRLFCLSHHYRSNIEWSDDRAAEAEVLLKKFEQFVSKEFSEGELSQSLSKWLEPERTLSAQLQLAADQVLCCLADDFDTRGALQAIMALMKHTNMYLRGSDIRPHLVIACQNWVSNTMQQLGLDLGGTAPSSNVDLAMDFRTKVREHALSSRDFELLKLCDDMRDRLLDVGAVVKDGK